MSIARHHAEWLSLVEASGPFLSLPVLLEVFPQGLEAHDPDHMRDLKLAHGEWQDDQQGLKPDVAIHRAWVEFVLKETLGLPEAVLRSRQALPPGLQVTFAEHGETLRPDWAVIDQSSPKLLIQVYPPEQDLNKTVKGSRWAASPATRMMELLHACDLRLGLVTNGEHWLLVNAPKGETTGYISWYATLWQEEPITLRAFRSLLGVERCFGVPAETLAELLAKSVNSQQEVTDQLGFQVRKAVEVLVQSLARIDQDQQALLQGVAETRLYEAALTVMMRLVFLFFAEENRLIPPYESALYDAHYAVSTLREQLREQADQQGEEILERRHDAWCRLLATFRAVYSGVSHDALYIPAYGGSLFFPDRFPFLEGRKEGSSWEESSAHPIPVNNRTVLHLLEALQVLQIRVPGGGVEPRRLSFRALDIEQIGHVYEGLLDHTAVRADESILGLEGTKNKEPEVSLAELEQLWQQGEAALVDFLKKATGRSKSALQKRVPPQSSAPSPHDSQRLLSACGNDEALFNRVLPWAALIRPDTFGYPTVIPAGSVYVTQGADRRETGTHYTPRSLTEEIVRYTLEPLVYEGVAAGLPRQQWRLKSAKQLLALKVCDLAMGSGAFLVQTCRYLAERLVEAWETEAGGEGPSRAKAAQRQGPVRILPDGSLSTAQPSEQLLPQDPDEQLAVARRIVADRCLYGVDKNPLAVEMAKLSLWLITLQKNKPFTFLNHVLRCGDSLIGASLEQLRYWNLDTSGTSEIFAEEIRWEIDAVIELRRQIANRPVNSKQDQDEKAFLLAKAQARTHTLKTSCDMLLSSYLNSLSKDRQESARTLLLRVHRGEADVPDELAEPLDLGSLEPFHWELEFPEVFVDEGGGGFDAIVGNPPFLGGQKITGALGTIYRDFLVEQIAEGKRGSADLCAYFFLRAGNLIKANGDFGLIATNTISQGDTREVGLDQLHSPGSSPGKGAGGEGFQIYRAVPSRKWPGTANLEVANVWLRKGKWQGESELDEKPVEGITPFLTVPGKAVGKPYRLADNQEKSFQGSIVLGMGFVLEPEEAQALIEKNPKNKDVLFPYLNGQDLNSRPDQSPSRWVINFQDWPLDAEHDDPNKPKGPPYAADYPDCLAIVEEKVKPERDKNNRKVYRDYWWHYAEKRPALCGAIADCDRVLVISLVNNHLGFAFEPSSMVFAHRVAVFPLDKWSHFGLFQSNMHYHWAWKYSSTLRKDINYSPSDCVLTFPFPPILTPLEQIGQRYYTHRQSIMQTRQEGLTKTYNRFHDPTEAADDIRTLRDLHIEMDCAVAAAYGWDDLDLSHGFHETKQGLRFTISEAARREVLDRLLALNHQRYAEEVAAGLHNKKKKTGKGKRKKAPKASENTSQLKLL